MLDSWLKKGVLLVFLLMAGISNASAEFSKSIGVMVGYPVWQFEEDGYYDTSEPALKLFSEVAINKLTRLELAIFSLGAIEDNVNYLDETVDAKGLSLSLARSILFSDVLSLRGKAGLFWSDSDIEVDGEVLGSDANLAPFVGVGLQLEVNKNIALRGEFEVYHLDVGYNVNVFSTMFGVVINFAN